MLLRQVLCPAARRLAQGGGVLAYRERQALHGINVLTYHRVLEDSKAADYPLSSLAMPVSAFRKQIGWLSTHCRVLPVNAAMTNAGISEISRPISCITFDDGYHDNYDLAAPILDEFGLKATFFITAGCVDTRATLWFDEAVAQYRNSLAILKATVRELGASGFSEQTMNSLPSWLAFLKQSTPDMRDRILKTLNANIVKPANHDKCQLMTREQVGDLSRRGHEIGSHTMTHPLLPQLNDEELRRELGESRRVLAGWTGQPITGLCYPNGDHDDRVVAAAKAAGFANACTTQSGINRLPKDTMRLNRIHIHPGRVLTRRGSHDELAFRAELCRLFEPWH